MSIVPLERPARSEWQSNAEGGVSVSPANTPGEYFAESVRDHWLVEPASDWQQIAVDRGPERRLSNNRRGTITASNTDRLVSAFQALAAVWHREISGASSVSMIVRHPAYEAIISFGPDVIPLILRQLRQEPDHWFVALCRLTGQNPAKYEETMLGAAMAWIEWGQEHGYID